ncbi:hypothetical protein KJY77_01245 [Canibacter sp. lx-72]|nr:hypothetical protein [Canibacter zhuwentaonis]MBT1017768.1 hypothetical protein [Canibacter zhuwentaonis]
MSGLAADTYSNEKEVELSWAIQAIVELADRLQLNSYPICLIRHGLQPSTVNAFEKSMLALGYYKQPQDIDLARLKTAMRERIATDALPADSVLEEVLKTHLEMLKLSGAE